MLRGANGIQRKPAFRPWNLLIFCVGGRRVAVRTEELARVFAWPGSIRIDHPMPGVSSVIRVNEAAVPVFDVADLLQVSVRGTAPLCLMAKHPHGALAMCVDEEMPVLHTLDPAAVHPYVGSEFPTIGSFSNGADEVPILSVSQIGVVQEISAVGSGREEG